MDSDRSTRSDASDRLAADPTPSGGGAAGALFAGLILVAVGCTDTEVSVTNPTETARLDVVEDVSAAPSPSSASASGVTQVARDVTVDEESDFVVESVDVVVHELQVAREGEECAFGQPGSGTGGDDGRDCLEVHVGIRVDTLPTEEGTREIVRDGQIEPGTFDRLVFRFDVVESGDIPARQDLEGASVKIAGTLGGEPFEILLAPEDEVSVAASPPLTIGEEESGEMTLHWAVASWFDDPDGEGRIDPLAAADEEPGGDLRSQIRANLVDALEVATSTGSG